MKELPVSFPNRRPSRLWTAGSLAALLLALVSLSIASFTYRNAQKPVGEGELFVAEAAWAVADFMDGTATPTDTALRHLRNELAIEAVSLVGSDGLIEASTSATLVGRPPSSPLLARYLSDGRFGAVAVPASTSIAIDGVTEWVRGDPLYEVIQPLPDGTGLLLSYDISALLERRARSGIPNVAIELAATGGAFLALGTILAISRGRAVRIHREMAIEAAYLSERTETLAAHNAELQVARARAEQALSLAEEKNRIRSEFVLMINHEFRTPLTGVVTGARLLQELTLDPSHQEILRSIVSEGSRLEHLTTQMLAVARIENRGLFLEVAPTPFAEVATDVSSVPHRQGVSVDFGESPDEMVLTTDRTTLSQLVASLADNALQHGAQQVAIGWTRVRPFVPMHEIGTHAEPSSYLLISDDGPGIDPEFLPRAFEKFEKRSFSSGTGLGLYLARLMAEAIGASIGVVTGPTGTTMAIGVPTTVRERTVA